MKTAIIILPGGIKKNGQLPFFVRARVDKAYYIYHQIQPDYVIVSGNKSLSIQEELPVSEAQAMASYLLRLGLPDDKIRIENVSQDLISSFYHVKTQFILPLKIKEVYVVASDFQKERAEYVGGKVFDSEVKRHFISAHSTLSPKVLWEFFTHERNSLLATRIFLSKMKVGNHEFLTHRFYNAPYYTSKSGENPQKMVYEDRIGKKSSIHKHYSLYTIFRKKEEIFATYKLTESKFHRGSKVDFWSGRFIPFVGRSENKTIHVLKFALLPKDKKKFEIEIQLTQLLKSKGILFTPTIITYNTTGAPWYLYKAMPGKIAGRFSTKFSFEEEFYREYVLNNCIHHLRKLRALDQSSMSFPKWNSRKYQTHFLMYYKVLEKYDEKVAHSPLLEQAKKYFMKKSAPLFDKYPLFVSHNDLHPANILISPRSEKVHFIDFEHVALNAITFDFCFLYVFSWDNVFFQQKLLKAFRKSLTMPEREAFDALFNITYCCFLVWLLAFVLTWEGRADRYRFQKARTHILKELKRIT